MSATAPRTATGTSDLRQLGVVIGTLIAAVALVVAVAIVRPASTSTAVSTTTVPPSVAHDHGWSSAGAGADLRGSSFDRLYASRAAGQSRGLVVRGSNGGAIRYTGIPYPAPSDPRTGGSNGTRFAR